MTRGTTPVISYKFKTIQADEITQAYLTLIQCNVKIEKTLETAVVDAEENTIGWTLTQDETLSLDDKKDVGVQIRYKIGDVAGASRVQRVPVSAILKEGVI